MTTRKGTRPTQSERPAPTRSRGDFPATNPLPNVAISPVPVHAPVILPANGRSATRSDRPTAIEKPPPLRGRTTTSPGTGPAASVAASQETQAAKPFPVRDSNDSRETRVEKELPLEARAASASRAGGRKKARSSIEMAAATKGSHYADRYEIRGLLGVGGMAAVYRAKDTWLGDEVALKVLSRDHADTPEAVGRFHREAMLARRITHPNVIRVYDVGNAGGEHFLTMQLVDGTPLLQRMTGPMPLVVALSIGGQLAYALAAVHAAGVFHGDVKPENVLLEEKTSLRVVLTDFGVSRRLEDPPPPPLPGHAGGTPIYMAPEQIEGRALSARTDLYALGIVLYEMIAGVPPWSLERGNTAATMSRLAIPPTNLRLRNASVPQELDDLVMRLLEREPSKRPQSSDEVAARLDAWRVRTAELSAGVTTSREGRSITLDGLAAISPVSSASASPPLAVLAVRANGEGKSGYLAEAFTNELIERLSRLPRLRVASRMAQKLVSDSDDARRTLARELGVDALVEGQLELRADGSLEVSVRLIDGRSAAVRWQTTAQRKAQDIFKLTGELADEIARAFAPVQVDNSPGFLPSDTPPPPGSSAQALFQAGAQSGAHASAQSGAQASPPPPASSVTGASGSGAPPAPLSSSSSIARRSEREAYLRAREAWNSGTADDTFRAERMLAESFAETKDDARAAALLAVAKVRRWTFDPRVSEGRTSLPDEAEALLSSFGKPEDVAVAEVSYAYALLAAMRLRGRDAIVHLKEALRLDPNLADAQVLFGRVLGETGDSETSEQALQKALTLDPTLVAAAAILVRNLELAGKRSRADEWLEWGETHAPDHPEMLLARLRVARWRRDSEAMKTLRVRAVKVSEGARGVISSALRVAAGANEDVEIGRLAASAAMPGAAPAMTVKWMEIIAEQRAHSGDLPGVLSAIRSADGAGSLDVIWLEGCPLLEKVRLSNALGQVRIHFNGRARDARSGR